MLLRYGGDADNGEALTKLLKLCSDLDPRFMQITEYSKEELVTQEVALGKLVDLLTIFYFAK